LKRTPAQSFDASATTDSSRAFARSGAAGCARRGLRTWACAIAFALCASGALADSTAQTFRLAGGELAALLNALAAQGRIQILYDAELLAGRRAEGLHGTYSVEAALTRLLRGTGLEAVAVNADTFVVKPAARSTPSPPSLETPVVPRQAPEIELSRVLVNDAGISRLAMSPTMPGAGITREQIDSSGYTTLFDLLKAQPGIQVANQPEAMAAASDANFRTGASGAAAVALRRLGSKSTLFLVDGRRIAGYGLAPDGTGTVPDLNAIPLAMIERIEILRDGASAIYGSDAVAGVVNILLRRDFSGAEASVYAGASDGGDAAAQQVSVFWGGRTAGGIGLLLNLNYLHASPLTGDQRSWYSLDQRRQGLRDLRSPYSFPGNIIYDDGSFEAAPGCEPRNLSARGLCVLDGAKFTTLQNGNNGKSLLGRLDVPLDGSTRLHLDLRVTDLMQRQQAAPSAAQLVLASLQEATEPQPIQWLYSFNDIGPVREATRSTLLSLGAGVDGRIGSWTWSMDASAQRNRVVDTIDGLVRDDAFRLSVDGERYTFGDTPPSAALRALMAPRAVRRGSTTLEEVSFATSGAAFDLPAGAASLSAGVELRREGVEQRPGPTLQSGRLLNQPREYPLSRHRVASAAFVKLDLPILDSLGADLAWRVEETGGFAAHGAPTLGLHWRPAESLLLRASSSSGYRAPTLHELYQPRSIGNPETVWVPESAGPCVDALDSTAGQAACLLSVTRGGNPALRPETSHTTAWGMVWSPSPSFSLSADVYRSVRRNEIAGVPVAYALDHADRFADFAVRTEDGRIAALNDLLVNLASTTTRGVDAEARWDADFGRAGQLRLNVGLNYLDALDRRGAPGAPAARSAGYAATPRLTGVSTARWALGDWIVGANYRYVGSYRLRPYADYVAPCAAYRAAQGKCSVPPFGLLNLNVTYSGIPHWAFTLSVNNVADHEPRYYEELSGGYNPAFDDPVGRYYAFRATYRF
jgi:outer membrane receptor protein involved in Fe transport